MKTREDAFTQFKVIVASEKTTRQYFFNFEMDARSFEKRRRAEGKEVLVRPIFTYIVRYANEEDTKIQLGFNCKEAATRMARDANNRGMNNVEIEVVRIMY